MVFALVGDSTTTSVLPPPVTASFTLLAAFDFAATFAFDFQYNLSHRDAMRSLHLKWIHLYVEGKGIFRKPT
jgi:hypothetical protein